MGAWGEGGRKSGHYRNKIASMNVCVCVLSMLRVCTCLFLKIVEASA